MKILLTSVGTRGDMEPFLAIAELLQEKGHDVVCHFPEQFRRLAEDSNIRFVSMGTEFIEMLDSEVGKFALGGGGSKWQKIMAYIRLAFMQKKVTRKMLESQRDVIDEEKPDKIIHHSKAIYPVIWEAMNPGRTVLVSPVPYLHYVRDMAHIGFGKDYGPFINKLSYRLADWGLVKTIMSSMKGLNMSGIRKKQIEQALKNHQVIYTISPQLFSRPDYWKNNMQVLGYHERNKSLNWEPNDELRSFLEKHQKVILFTFGSMTNPEPEKKTKIVLDVLTKNKIPTIINTAGGGLVEPENYNREYIHFVSRIPYDWIFPRVYAVVHHGGSGTTHTALKYGCATMVIPHIIDQFVWNRIVSRIGAGPLGIPVGKISAGNLGPKILDVLNREDYKKVAEKIAAKMGEEDFREEIVNAIIN